MAPPDLAKAQRMSTARGFMGRVRHSYTRIRHILVPLAFSGKSRQAPRDAAPIAQEFSSRRIDADMIALTTHGRGGMKRFFLGSTAEQIMRHATCPVLSVRRH